jgi:hypothetical protein
MNKDNSMVKGILLILILFLHLLQMGCGSPYVLNKMVTLDLGKLSKKEIKLGHFIGGICNIQTVDYSKTSERAIAVIGQSNYYIVSSDTFNELEYKVFKDSRGYLISLGLYPQLIDIDADGQFEILLRGGGFGKVGLLDHEGKKIWHFFPDPEYPKYPPYKMISPNPNNDEIFFYSAGDTGLYKLNAKGDILAHLLPSPVLDVSLFSNNTIVALNMDNEFEFINITNEKLQKKLKISDSIDFFQIIDWHSKEGILIENENNELKILSSDGEILFQYDITNFPSYHPPQGVQVKFEADKQPYLAILLHARSSVRKSQLCIFSPKGDLIYQEVLDATEGISIRTDKNKRVETLLVGNGQEGLFEYSIK